MPEGGSADLSIPASRAGNGAGAPKGRPAAVTGRPEGEAAGDLAFPGETVVPPGNARSPSAISDLWVTLNRRKDFSRNDFFTPKLRE